MSLPELYGLTIEYRQRPLGMDVEQPRFSWKLRTAHRSMTQSSYRIQVAAATLQYLPIQSERQSLEVSESMYSLADNKAERHKQHTRQSRPLVAAEADQHPLFAEPLWDSGVVSSSQSVHFTYDGPALQPCTRYVYRVCITDDRGQTSAWSDVEWWETGLLHTESWRANWITPHPQQLAVDEQAAFLLRRTFTLAPDIVSARIYMSALGMYELYCNGQRVSDDWLAPGWTSYHHRLQYQTYDLTALLQTGSNTLGVVLADGWYKGGMGDAHYRYGQQRALITQLHVQYADGSTEQLTTDEQWRANTGAIRYANLYNGEIYDARLNHTGWTTARFDDAQWHPIQYIAAPQAQLIAQEHEPVRITQRLSPVAVLMTPNGDTVLDMGQNMVGRIRMTVQAKAGTTIVLRHAEVLDSEGNLYVANLKEARQQVTYIARGDAVEQYAPHFTFHGFRYVQVQGYPQGENGLPLEHFIGEVMHTQLERTGHFACSEPLVNQLYENVIWGQRGNFVDVPTDCPQRSERLGWTADAQVFAATALLNYQCGAFFGKWLRDLRADQLPDGGVPFVVPNVMHGASAAGWGDAAVIVPWTLYQYYGDVRILEQQYDSMVAWVEYIRRQGDIEQCWDTGFQFGDWLALDAQEGSYVGATPRELVATAYYAYSVRKLRDTAEVLGRIQDRKMYDDLLTRICTYMQGEYITPHGRVAAPTQTAHVLALMFELVPPAQCARIAADLNTLIVDNGYHLTTGFVGTPYLCFALSDHGYHDTALKLLLQEEYPGWLYAVKRGATTIWEHWDSLKPDGSFWSDNMNSFNHYAYGSIAEWLYRRVAGLEPDMEHIGGRQFTIAPRLDGRGLTYAHASYESLYGTVRSGWRLADGEVHIHAVIPPNCHATIRLPYAELTQVQMDSASITQKRTGVQARQQGNDVRVSVGSGSYEYRYPCESLCYAQYDEHTPLKRIYMYDEDREIVERCIPEVTLPPLRFYASGMSLRQLMDEPAAGMTERRILDTLQQLNRRLY